MVVEALETSWADAGGASRASATTTQPTPTTRPDVIGPPSFETRPKADPDARGFPIDGAYPCLALRPEREGGRPRTAATRPRWSPGRPRRRARRGRPQPGGDPRSGPTSGPYRLDRGACAR